MHQNVRGLVKKTERLNHLLSTLRPTILILTEHGLNSETILLSRLNGYNLITDFSRQNHKLGGVAIYLDSESNLDVKAVDITMYPEELLCEAAAVRIDIKKNSFYLLGIYRTPGGQTKQAIEVISKILSTLQADTKQIIIMGDVNFDRLIANQDNLLFEEELTTFGLKRLPLPATRITSSSETSIDCICTNLSEDKLSFSIIQGGISDHTGQLCNIQNEAYKANTQESTCKRIFNKQNLECLREELAAEKWDTIYNSSDAEEAYSAFQTIVKRALDLACPRVKRRIKSRKNKLQYDYETNLLKEEFLTCLRRYEVTGNESDRDEMKIKKKAYDLHLRELRRTAAKEYIINSDNKSKATWNIINAEKQHMKIADTLSQLEIEGKIIDNPTVIAEHLNQYFCQIADITLTENRSNLTSRPSTTANSTQHDRYVTHDSRLCTLVPTTHKEVLCTINSLTPKLSCGIDEVPPKAVKYCGRELASPLAAIINKSFNLGQFPSMLKLSKVYPKHKKGPTTKQENYRPISLISIFSKIMEKIALKRMTHYLQEQELLSKNQHGFLKGRSTISAISSLVEYIIDQQESNKFVSAILLDYSKAFDCLGHDLILKKLSALGIQDRAREWVSSYLRGRTQIVELQRTIDNKMCTFRSRPQPLTRGVPQGSVLGPFLFVLFTNDFNNFINDDDILPIMYADDTTLLTRHDTAQGLHSNITSSTEKALEYCLQNDLVVNPSKTVQLNFSRKHEQIPVIPNILVDNKTKLLGMTLDTDLSWTEHINILSKKVGSGIFAVRRVMWISGQEAAKVAYYALVESHIRYGLAVWGGTSQQNLDRILILQKKAIRTLANLPVTESCGEAFKSLKIMTVIALYIYSLVLYMDQKEFSRGENFHSYNTRRAADYVLPAHRTTSYSRKPSYMGRKVLNSFPQQMKILKGQQLKKQLQDWLVKRPFYSMKEFFDRKFDN